MKFRKIVETSIYSSNLEKMNEFYVDKLGLDFVSEQKGRHIFLKTEKKCFLFLIMRLRQLKRKLIMGHPVHHRWFIWLLR
jgi:catechol 2,3-dioxygenase-like lactoylglutathione lyase family enzyme